MLTHLSRMLLFSLLLCILAVPGWCDSYLTNGLVAHYTFTGNAEDSSPSQQTATVINATLTTDRFGRPNQAYAFDAVNDYLVRSADALPTSTRTVSLWFNMDSNADAHPVLLGYGGNGNANSFFMMIDRQANQLIISAHYNPALNEVATLQSSLAGAWHHWIVTTDASGTTMYLDGVQVFTTSRVFPTTAVTDRALAIGVDISGYGVAPYVDPNVDYFKGKLDDIRTGLSLTCKHMSEFGLIGAWASSWYHCTRGWSCLPSANILSI